MDKEKEKKKEKKEENIIIYYYNIIINIKRIKYEWKETFHIEIDRLIAYLIVSYRPL